MNTLRKRGETLIDKTDYGTNHIGTPRRTEGGGWERIDTYHGQDGHTTDERRFAAGPNDFSPMARTMYAGKGNCEYHPKCSCCWLGFSHTLANHNLHAVGSWD